MYSTNVKENEVIRVEEIKQNTTSLKASNVNDIEISKKIEIIDAVKSTLEDAGFALNITKDDSNSSSLQSLPHLFSSHLQDPIMSVKFDIPKDDKNG